MPTADLSKPRSTLSKAAYILTLPRALPVRDVVQQGKRDGYELTDVNVYNARSYAKHKALRERDRKRAERAERKRAALESGARAPNGNGNGNGNGADHLRALRVAAAELGFKNAIAIIERDRELFTQTASHE